MTPATTSAKYKVEDLTINVCTVDRLDTLLACIDSLLRTTPSGVTLNIMCNGSSKELVEAARARVEPWDGPCHVEVLDEIIPVTDSHNHALSLVRTPLVQFMGDDDLVLGNRVPALLEAFNTLDPEPLAVTSFARRIAGDAFEPRIGSNKELGPTTIDGWREARDRGEMFELLWPGAILNTEALRGIGGFDADFARTFDNRIFTNLSSRGPVLSIENHDFGFRIHEGSISTTNFLVSSQQVRHVQACRTAEVEGRTPPTTEEFAAMEQNAPAWTRMHVRLRSTSRMHFRRGSAFLFEGDRKLEAIRHLAASAFLWPPAFFEKLTDQGDPLRSLRRLATSRGN